MAEMTILHIASPFAFSMPVAETRSSTSAGDDQGGAGQDAGHVPVEPAGANAARDGGVVDARDARSALMRTGDPGLAALGSKPVPASMDAVLAAYRQDAPPADGANEPAE